MKITDLGHHPCTSPVVLTVLSVVINASSLVPCLNDNDDDYGGDDNDVCVDHRADPSIRVCHCVGPGHHLAVPV